MLKINGKITKVKLKKILKYILKDNKKNLDIIEIFGVDGAGKSYLASKIIKKNLKNKKIKVKIIHLWKFQNRNQNVNTQKPYLKSNYIYPVSLIKEFYIMIQIIILIFKIFSMRKSSEVYIFERSIYDVIIDPSRYRLSHNPILIKIIYNIFFRNAKKIYIDASYKIIKKRKDELSKKKYLYLTNKLNKYYKKEVHGL
jgi:thymidylate kinase